MWNHQASIDSSATPAQIWNLFRDVPGWKAWNAGIDQIEIHGPFRAGTTFSMQPPGCEPLTSTLTAVTENEGFTDETVIDGTRVVVTHRLVPLASGGTRIIYETVISGEAAAAFGPMVTSDFPEVLQALKALAERAK